MIAAMPLNTGPRGIDAIFDFAMDQQFPAITVFPALRTESQLVDQLLLLQAGQRWTLSREVVIDLVTDDVLVGLRWQTPAGLHSLPMGFGPFGTMPVTRRAPYVCIATWPGGHENPHRKKFEPNVVDFLDSALPEPLTATQYRDVWNSSTKRTGELLSELADSPSFYRRVAFRLSANVANRF